jgi:hypothetical protein
MATPSNLLPWLWSKADAQQKPRPPKANPDEKHSYELLGQFYSTLRVMWLAARQDTGTQALNSEIDEKIKQLLDEPPLSRSWRDAYEIEQLLNLVMTEQQLNAELSRRLEEAKDLKLPYINKLEEIAGQQTDIKARRALFQRLLNDLQWFYSQRIQRSETSKKLGSRVSSMFFVAFVVFFFVISIQFFAQPRVLVEATDNGANENSPDELSDETTPPQK